MECIRAPENRAFRNRGLGIDELELGKPLREDPDRHRHVLLGEVNARAALGTASEHEVRRLLPIRIEDVGIREDVGIPIRRRYGEEHP